MRVNRAWKVLFDKTEKVHSDWLLFNSRLCAARVQEYSWDPKEQFCNLIIVALWAPKDSSTDDLKDVFFDALLNLVRMSESSAIEMVAGYIYAWVGKRTAPAASLDGHCALPDQCGNRLLLSSTDIWRS